MTLIPRLAKPDLPRATWNVSLSLSSWTPAESRSPLVSNVAVTSDELLTAVLLSMFSTLLSDASPVTATGAEAADALLVG